MHNPILAPANRPTITARLAADMAIVCPTCLDTLTPNGQCLNVGACESADLAATRSVARGATVKAAPAAWTRRGNVD